MKNLLTLLLILFLVACSNQELDQKINQTQSEKFSEESTGREIIWAIVDHNEIKDDDWVGNELSFNEILGVHYLFIGRQFELKKINPNFHNDTRIIIRVCKNSKNKEGLVQIVAPGTIPDNEAKKFKYINDYNGSIFYYCYDCN